MVEKKTDSEEFDHIELDDDGEDISRRVILRHLGLFGAAAFVIPTIVTISEAEAWGRRRRKKSKSKKSKSRKSKSRKSKSRKSKSRKSKSRKSKSRKSKSKSGGRRRRHGSRRY